MNSGGMNKFEQREQQCCPCCGPTCRWSMYIYAMTFGLLFFVMESITVSMENGDCRSTFQWSVVCAGAAYWMLSIVVIGSTRVLNRSNRNFYRFEMLACVLYATSWSLLIAYRCTRHHGSNPTYAYNQFLLKMFAVFTRTDDGATLENEGDIYGEGVYMTYYLILSHIVFLMYLAQAAGDFSALACLKTRAEQDRRMAGFDVHRHILFALQLPLHMLLIQDSGAVAIYLPAGYMGQVINSFFLVLFYTFVMLAAFLNQKRRPSSVDSSDDAEEGQAFLGGGARRSNLDSYNAASQVLREKYPSDEVQWRENEDGDVYYQGSFIDLQPASDKSGCLQWMHRGFALALFAGGLGAVLWLQDLNCESETYYYYSLGDFVKAYKTFAAGRGHCHRRNAPYSLAACYSLNTQIGNDWDAMSNCILARQFLWSGNFTATEDDRDTEQVDASDLHVPAPGKERLAARVFTDSEWKLLGRWRAALAQPGGFVSAQKITGFDQAGKPVLGDVVSFPFQGDAAEANMHVRSGDVINIPIQQGTSTLDDFEKEFHASLIDATRYCYVYPLSEYRDYWKPPAEHGTDSSVKFVKIFSNPYHGNRDAPAQPSLDYLEDVKAALRDTWSAALPAVDWGAPGRIEYQVPPKQSQTTLADRAEAADNDISDMVLIPKVLYVQSGGFSLIAGQCMRTLRNGQGLPYLGAGVGLSGSVCKRKDGWPEKGMDPNYRPM
ncbi:unnamed protein product [Amoebophrya sp. A120]|nr:unnamed protein product [Amoebophrya sp. A120]|eukprot:GSA120T00000442001.1